VPPEILQNEVDGDHGRIQNTFLFEELRKRRGLDVLHADRFVVPQRFVLDPVEAKHDGQEHDNEQDSEIAMSNHGFGFRVAHG